MNAGQIRYAIEDILARNRQNADRQHCCPWCGAGRYGIDSAGQPVSDREAMSFEVAHFRGCAAEMLEAVLRGDYVYLNPPLAVIVPPMPEPNVMRLAGANTVGEDILELRFYLRKMAVAVIDRAIQILEELKK